ncbi:MAG: aminotransferase class I/II-fold pyridoxal phosphate-dependent enzyme [Pseudomonadales bacterium]|nr:aminotransferase class I/II-fold pyridoxal phosphate-dependent enzyme [Pseudomonadales bacterium]
MNPAEPDPTAPSTEPATEADALDHITADASADEVSSIDRMPVADDVPDVLPSDLRDDRFQVEVAQRVKRLPPYMFGRINNLLYEKRRAGEDVIDMGMGNPSDPPEPLVIDKLAQAAADPRVHGYSKSNGIQNLRREVASKYLKKYGVRLDPEEEVTVCLGSKEGFSHMCLALMGPGDTAIVPAPYFPVHTYAVA